MSKLNIKKEIIKDHRHQEECDPREFYPASCMDQIMNQI